MDLTNKKVVVIGGAGLIGSHTVDRLLETDVGEIVVFDNFSRGNKSNLAGALNDKRTKLFDLGGDICQPDLLQECLVGADGVFNFAALWLLHCHEYPESAFEVNVRGSFNVMQACVAKNVKRLVYSSSASVYGDADFQPMTEDHPFNNKNFYGATKICSEAMLRAFYHRYGLDYVGLRYMNVYGPRQDYKGTYVAVIMKMLDAIDSGSPIQIMGDGTESFDFVSVHDCALANVKAMKATTCDEFYNVGTGIKTSLTELAETILDLTGSNVGIEYRPNNNNTLVKNRVGSVELARKNIGFTSEVGLSEGLEMLIQWRNIDKSDTPNGID